MIIGSRDSSLCKNSLLTLSISNLISAKNILSCHSQILCAAFCLILPSNKTCRPCSDLHINTNSWRAAPFVHKQFFLLCIVACSRLTSSGPRSRHAGLYLQEVAILVSGFVIPKQCCSILNKYNHWSVTRWVQFVEISKAAHLLGAPPWPHHGPNLLSF